MRDLTDHQIQLAMPLLEQATYNHEQWHRGVMRVLVARVPPEASDLMPDAFHRCRFGQSFDSESAELLRPHAAFVALGEAHERMHSSATQLLQRVADDLPVSAPALDHFDNALDRMRLELASIGTAAKSSSWPCRTRVSMRPFTLQSAFVPGSPASPSPLSPAAGRST